MQQTKVFLVEDNFLIGNDIMLKLQNIGYVANKPISSAEKALQEIEKFAPDIALLDIQLRGEMDGIELATIIKNKYKIPVVFLTAYSNHKILDKAKLSDPFGYVIKPYSLRELRVTVEMALYKYKIEQQLVTSEQRHRIISELSSDFFYSLICDSADNLSFEWISKAFQRVTSYSKKEVENFNTWISHIYSHDQVILKDAIGKLLKNESVSIEYRIYNKMGKIIWINDRLKPIYDESQNKVIRIFGAVQDITKRKLAEIKLEKSYLKIKNVFCDTVMALASAMELRDQYIGGHLRKVAALSSAIAEKLGLSEDEVEGIRITGLLHDIGKIKIPGEILNKPRKLTSYEYNFIKEHPQTGYDILNEVDFPWPVAQTVLQHHEKLDGSGYPNGLKGSEIILPAKIIIVADVVSAMCSSRPYRGELGIEAALQKIENGKGTLYDSKIVDACVDLFENDNFTLNEKPN
ncbi:MAG: HD domain-containing phosphohydrolase [Candidatus Cloacimonadota bacterium]|nr:HD domain-containing phosphohydrolase [Candidatus Cloacimonadota bacterium]